MYKFLRKIKKNIIGTISIGIILSILLTVITPVGLRADGDKCIAENITLTVNGTDTFNVKAVSPYYENNTYVSLRDMALALAGTEKNFNVYVSSSEISITTGADYETLGNDPFSDSVTSQVYGVEYTLGLNLMKYNGDTIKYFSIIGSPCGEYDAFISTTDFALIFDTDIWYEGANLYIDTTKPFTVDIDSLDNDGYFTLVTGAIVGDATTGEILYEYEGDRGVPIASTTKLMTYLVAMDAVARGSVSLNDTVYVSENAHKLSEGIDGTIRLTTGSSATLEEFMMGMLMASSNECALVIAEYVAGSEDLFVDMMNTTAESLGLSDETVFYNSNGLPVYNEDVVTAKLQNRMTPEDMFILCSHILNKYPQVTDITSLKGASLPGLGTWVNNTNFLLYNMSNCVGLKTGTTNKAGACLVSAITVEVDGQEHIIVAAEYGAESSFMRVTASEVLLTYGRQAVEGVVPSEHGAAAGETRIPETAEGLCSLIVGAAKEQNPSTFETSEEYDEPENTDEED